MNEAGSVELSLYPAGFSEVDSNSKLSRLSDIPRWEEESVRKAVAGSLPSLLNLSPNASNSCLSLMKRVRSSAI